MGKRDGLIPLMTYLPEEFRPTLNRRLKQVKKTKAVYLRGLIEADLAEARMKSDGLDLKAGRPRKEEDAK